MPDSFKEARKLNNIFTYENRSLFINFSLIEAFHSGIYPNVILPKYPAYNLSDEDFLCVLQKKETFKKLNGILVSILVDIQRLEGIDRHINKTIKVLN